MGGRALGSAGVLRISRILAIGQSISFDHKPLKIQEKWLFCKIADQYPVVLREFSALDWWGHPNRQASQTLDFVGLCLGVIAVPGIFVMFYRIGDIGG